MRRPQTESNFPWFSLTKCVDKIGVIALETERFTKAIFTSADVVQVNVSAASGDMGILANHVPSVEALRPGVVEVIESGNTSKKWFGMYPSFELSSNCLMVHFTSIWRICDRAPEQQADHQRGGGGSFGSILARGRCQALPCYVGTHNRTAGYSS